MPVTWCYKVKDGMQYCSTGFPMGCYFRDSRNGQDLCSPIVSTISISIQLFHAKSDGLKNSILYYVILDFTKFSLFTKKFALCSILINLEYKFIFFFLFIFDFVHYSQYCTLIFFFNQLFHVIIYLFIYFRKCT